MFMTLQSQQRVQGQLREPIVRHGPFIMTSQPDIKQAFTDYQNGLF